MRQWWLPYWARSAARRHYDRSVHNDHNRDRSVHNDHHNERSVHNKIGFGYLQLHDILRTLVVSDYVFDGEICESASCIQMIFTGRQASDKQCSRDHHTQGPGVVAKSKCKFVIHTEITFSENLRDKFHLQLLPIMFSWVHLPIFTNWPENWMVDIKQQHQTISNTSMI